jgi:hypothetical protein
VRNKKIVGAGVAVAASAALLLAASPAFADEESFVDSAYAFSASGLLDIGPLPAGVESTDGEPVGKEVIGLGGRTSDAEANGIFVGVLNASAEAGRSEASVARVELLDILRADVIRTHCEDADPDLSGLQIINGTLLGQPLPKTPLPSTEINLSPLATATLNDQVRNADGSLTVTGVELKVLPGRDDDVNETLETGPRCRCSVTCSVSSCRRPCSPSRTSSTSSPAGWATRAGRCRPSPSAPPPAPSGPTTARTTTPTATTTARTTPTRARRPTRRPRPSCRPASR